MTAEVEAPIPEDVLRSTVVAMVIANAGSVSEAVAHDIAEDVLSALDLTGLVLAYRSKIIRIAAPADGTICRGSCERGVYSKQIPKAKLPPGGVHHHARGFCGSCNSQRTRALRQEQKNAQSH